MTTAAGAELEPIWATLLAKALEGKNIKDLLSNIGAGGAAPAAGAPAAAAAGGAAAEETKEEEKKEEEKEESDDDMVRRSHIAQSCPSLTEVFYRVSGSSTNFLVFSSFCSLLSSRISLHFGLRRSSHSPCRALYSHTTLKR